MSSAIQAAPMPLIAPTNWPMISGFSGLPKFRLSVAARGVAPHGDEVAPGLGHRLFAALERVGLDIARRHVGGEGERLGRAMDADHAGAEAGGAERVGHDLAVILLPYPGFVGVVRASRSARATRRSGRSAGPGPSRRRAGSRPRDGRIPGRRRTSFDSGRSALISLPCRIRKRSSAMVSPTMAKSRSHLSKTALASASFSGLAAP